MKAWTDLTPVQCRDGLWLKREDLYALPNGVNGGKLRACRYLLEGARAAGATQVISAASLLSPQNAMAATLAAELGMGCTVIVGATTPRTAVRHTAFRLATDAGAQFRFVRVGYNPALQKAAADLQAASGGYWLRYGITPPPTAPLPLIRGFHETTSDQIGNLPPDLKTLVIPFGSGNTGAGVIYGLLSRPLPSLQRVVLVAIGPGRMDWLRDRLDLLGTPLRAAPWQLETIDLHGSGYASYGDRMPEKLGGVNLHPTYEGKVARWLNAKRPAWWSRRDGTTCLWVVGGPLPRRRGSAS